MSRFRYQASLAETTLPEMLCTVERFRVPGVLEARNRETTKHVYVRDGYIVHAASSDRRDSLGAYLVRKGGLSEAQRDRLSQVRGSSNQRLGVLLLQEDLATPAAVRRAIQEHIEQIVWSLFAWQEGEVSFSVGEFQGLEMIQIQLPMKQVVVRGMRQMPDARPLVSRLGRRETVFEPCYGWEQLIEIGLDEDEYRMIRLVDGERTLYELCSEGPMAPGDNAKVVYALHLLQLVRPRASAEPEGGRVRVRLKTRDDAGEA